MSHRPLLLTTFLAASVAVPYAMHHPGLRSAATGLFSKGEQASLATADAPEDLIVMPGATTPMPREVEGPQVRDFREVFRFDVTPEWVFSRWARVSTAAGEFDLQGYRVPLVTGTGHDDLAGALSYYFDRRHRLTRIAFRGTTGDTRRLVATLTREFSLEQKFSGQPQVVRYQTPAYGTPKSSLEITLAPVIEGNRPHHRYEVAIVLGRAPDDDDTSPEELALRKKRYSFHP